MESLHIKSKVKKQRNHNVWDSESEEYNSSSTSEVEKYPRGTSTEEEIALRTSGTTKIASHLQPKAEEIKLNYFGQTWVIFSTVSCGVSVYWKENETERSPNKWQTSTASKDLQC